MASRKRGLTEEEIRNLLQELSDASDEEVVDDFNDSNFNPAEESDESDHVSTIEEETSDDELDISVIVRANKGTPASYSSRNGTEWCKTQPATSRER